MTENTFTCLEFRALNYFFRRYIISLNIFVTFHTKILTSLKMPMHVLFLFFKIQWRCEHHTVLFLWNLLWFLGRKMIKWGRIWARMPDQHLMLGAGIFFKDGELSINAISMY